MYFLVQKGALGVALFIVVMWIGTFSRDGALSRRLCPIRAELSIMACILISGHMLNYLSAYVARIWAGNLNNAFLTAALVVAFCLLALVIVLGVTSLRAVKRRMGAGTWKRVQGAAYFFYALVLIHVLLMLMPSAVSGGASAQVTVAVYGVVFCVYAAARIRRGVLDRKGQVDLVETVKDQGFDH